MRSAVLLLVFNRPDTTREVFEAIRAARPPRLYVAADGPRHARAGEMELCAEVRRIATNVDWPCEVKTLFRATNLGCKLGPVCGINWLFEHEEEGIILEDDVVPLPSFFDYCDDLLERYRHDERVGLVSGSNLISKRFTPQTSYFFSRYSLCWGWACWRRAWKHYDVAMQAWPAWRDQDGLKSISGGSRLFEAYWRDVLDRTYRGGIDWWDYQWVFACWHRGMLGVLPAHNQTHNLGFGPGATHTIASTPAYVRESIPQLLAFPLEHPARVERTPSADTLMDKHVFELTLIGSGKRQIMRIKRQIRHTPFLGEFLTRVKRGLIDAKRGLLRRRS
jgi:hypothetical protein